VEDAFLYPEWHDALMRLRGRALRAAGAAAALCLATTVGAVAGGVPVPAPEEIIHRVLTANADTPNVVAVDALFKFRVKKAVTDPADCVFEGTLTLEPSHQAVAIGRHTIGTTCWLVGTYVIGRLFAGAEPVEMFLSRFDFEVLGVKLVDGIHSYLVLGRARDPRTNPRGMIGWVDYDRGLVTEGTIRYAWGTLDMEQRYTQVEGAWVLSYQYLYLSRFSASMEVFYSNVRFAPR
jgi:hypothetical protein